MLRKITLEEVRANIPEFAKLLDKLDSLKDEKKRFLITLQGPVNIEPVELDSDYVNYMDKLYNEMLLPEDKKREHSILIIKRNWQIILDKLIEVEYIKRTDFESGLVLQPIMYREELWEPGKVIRMYWEQQKQYCMETLGY